VRGYKLIFTIFEPNIRSSFYVPDITVMHHKHIRYFTSGRRKEECVRYTESEERENPVVKEATSAKNDYLTLGIHDQAARLDEKSIKLSYPIF
jgi:hypothetical protein